MTAKKSLENLIANYDFQCDDVNVVEILQDAINCIEKLESDYKGLQDIIEIQRHNIAVMRRKKK